jgi:DNA mismatch repair ATPase MutS
MSEKKIIATCAVCGKPIYEGEEYVQRLLRGGYAHKMCDYIQQARILALLALARK